MKTAKSLPKTNESLWRFSNYWGHLLHKKAINRSIVIDFEGAGRANGASRAPRPIFLGVLKSGAYCGYFIDDRFPQRFLRKAKGALTERINATSLDVLIGALVEQAEKEDRVILHFSQHEPKLLERYLEDPNLIVRLKAVLADGKPLMEKGVRKLKNSPAKSRDLASLAGALVPEIAAQQIDMQVGDLTRSLEKAAARGMWKETHLRKLQQLLHYNRLDLEMLQKGARAAR